MLLCYVDEANPEPNNDGHPESRFLVFGATLMQSSAAIQFNEQVEQIRADNGFETDDAFKFALHDKPAHVTNEQHLAAKSQTLEAAVDLGAKVILYCALHRIIDGQGQDTYLNWGVDACITKIQQYYTENEMEDGFFCFLDRHSRASMSSYMRSKFQKRLIQGRAGYNTPNLIGVGQIWDGTSHLASLCDIVTGSFNYVVNNPERDIAGKALIKALKPMVWSVPGEEGRVDVMGRGLLFRPEEQSVRYAPHYEETRSRIVDWANE